MILKTAEIADATGGCIVKGDREKAVTGVSIDTRTIVRGSLFVPLRGSNVDGHMFIKDAFTKGAHACLVQKGNSYTGDFIISDYGQTIIEVNDTLRALGELACFWRKKFPIVVAAVTGSNGKTSTKEMAWKILNRSFCTFKNPGNFNNLIGLPLSLFHLNGKEQVGVVEMGMSQRGEIKRLAEIAGPQIGLITNIGHAHLEQMKCIDEIMEAKGELFESLGNEDTAIINCDDFRVVQLVGKTRARVIGFGVKKGDVRALNVHDCGWKGIFFDISILGKKVSVSLNLPGRHSLSNALAAAAIAHAFGADIKDIKKGLEEFEAVPGRAQIVNTGNYIIIDDSYNANPDSMNASLDVLCSISRGKRAIAVLGDMLELGEKAEKFHRELGRQAAKLSIDVLFVVGSFATHVKYGAVSEGMLEDHIFIYNDVRKLAAELAKEIKHEDVVLIKGSRAMKMERIIEFLQKKAGVDTETVS